MNKDNEKKKKPKILKFIQILKLHHKINSAQYKLNLLNEEINWIGCSSLAFLILLAFKKLFFFSSNGGSN